MKSYNEFCKEQAERLFEIIETHQGLLQWQKSWQVKGNNSLPKGVGGFYQGINLWKLLTEQTTCGLGSSIWLTYNQIKQKGGQVLKGAKGKQVCFFKLREIETENANGDNDARMVPLFRLYTVFNLDQANMAGQEVEATTPAPKPLQQLITFLKVTVSEFGNQPQFQPVEDVIVMPRRECFVTPSDFDVTLLHELVHWTGHQSRLNRETIRDYGKSDAIRAEEELIAEIGSVFLASYFGVAGDLINHASYVSSWKKLLDEKAIGRAMSQASRAFAWLVNQLEDQAVVAAA
tara:strand:- start:815 stop:1684 length:870 start_codon:yes stop_codon:yes gene_type:complete